MSQQTGISHIYDEINKALELELYYSAITITTSLPDICQTMTGIYDRTNFQTYKEWFRQYAASKFSKFGADECYALRCGISHNARTMGGVSKHTEYDGIILSLPNSQNWVTHECVYNDSYGLHGKHLIIYVLYFCERMIEAAQDWEHDTRNNKQVKENYKSLARYKEHGLPHVNGILLPAISGDTN